VAQLVQYGTFPLQNIGFMEGAHPIAAELTTCSQPTGSRTPDSRCFVEERCRTVPVVPLFLKALRGKVAQLVQYGTFPLHYPPLYCTRVFRAGVSRCMAAVVVFGSGVSLHWPLHDIVITNMLWCMAYEWGGRWGGVHCALAVQ